MRTANKIIVLIVHHEDGIQIEYKIYLFFAVTTPNVRHFNQDNSANVCVHVIYICCSLAPNKPYIL